MSVLSPWQRERLESALGLLVTANLEVLAALDALHGGALAVGALHPQHNLLGGLRLLVENGLGLTAVSGLLAVVTALTLRVRAWSLEGGRLCFPPNNFEGGGFYSSVETLFPLPSSMPELSWMLQ